MIRQIFLVLSLASWLLAGSSVDTIGFTVSDLDRSIDFYVRVLGFEKVSERELAGEEYEHLEGVFGLRMRTARLRLGDEFIDLTEYVTPRGLPIPQDARSNDRWFQHVAIIVSNMPRAYQRLRDNKVRHASPSPQRLPDWNPNAGGIEAFYFFDPDAHPLEILYFPAGKGNPKWQARDGRLFLGIDHTAIVIGNTDASVNFYCNTLGLHVAGESENYGPEQERLNNVFGARLRITALRGDAGPGVELLEYVAPRDGRPFPASHANDLFHVETSIETSEVDPLALALRKARAVFVSSGTIRLGTEKAVIFRDPDGHAVKIHGK